MHYNAEYLPKHIAGFRDAKKVHLQIHLDGSPPSTTHIKTQKQPSTFSFTPPSASCFANSAVTKFGGMTSTHVQLHLSYSYSAINAILKIDDLLNGNHLSEPEIVRYLWTPFPLYNLSNERMVDLINQVLEIFREKEKIVVSSQLLSLAALNAIDVHVSRKSTSHYFKTKILKGISSGRRSYAVRILNKANYIEEHGNCWHRTNKKFNRQDFWLESTQP